MDRYLVTVRVIDNLTQQFITDETYDFIDADTAVDKYFDLEKRCIEIGGIREFQNIEEDYRECKYIDGQNTIFLSLERII